MDQQSTMAIAAMMNAFPSGREDIDVRMRTLDATLHGLAPAAIIEAAQRFMAGDVEEQSKTRAPTVPEFTQEAKRIDAMKRRISNPLPPQINHRRVGMSSHEREIQRRKDKYAGRAVLHEKVTKEQHMTALRQCPPGSEWCWYHQAIFAPENSPVRAGRPMEQE